MTTPLPSYMESRASVMTAATPSYTVTGPSDAHSIIFLHGAAWTRAQWLPQVAALSAEFQVIACDLPGHGALAAYPFHLTAALQEVEHLVALCHHRRPLLVGLSLGGYVALAYAAEHPQHCAGVIGSGCCLAYRGPLGWLSRLDAALVTRLVSPQRLARMQAATVQQRYPAALADPQLAAGFTLQAMPAIYRELTKQHIYSLMRQYPGPSLILNGEHDRLNRRFEARLLAATQHGRVQHVPDAGHLVNLDQPAAFTAAVRAFAQTLPWEDLTTLVDQPR